MVFDCTTSKSKYFRDCIGFAILSYAMGPIISRRFPSCSFSFEGIRDEEGMRQRRGSSPPISVVWVGILEATPYTCGWHCDQASFKAFFLLVFAGMSFTNKRKRGPGCIK